ncbi:ABC transporter substrate-binding protein [Actinomadura madurae]|nr:ABC transporter substrate-binding protein [Actinomadura madurae]MCP9949793.1 ABC transporter substrate-binding protein [Actinomadura madurae]MCP9979035.1 ABC transporter substrate-binding protein [Actinomadura madurae]MCQ0009439.1 ABC transporter substrate-binding protein [Actinomadura madurae]
MRVKGWSGGLVAAGLLLAGCGGGPGGGGGKISDDGVVLAVLNDASGVYADTSGSKSVEAVKMAVADFKAKYGDKAVTDKIEVLSADHQNKPEIANSKAQELYDRQHADVILDVPTSSAAFAVATIAKNKKKVFIDVGAASTELEGKQCNKYTFHYGYNSYMLAHSTGTEVTKDGGKNWYIVYPDYAFGEDMQRTFSTAIKAAGGSVVKSDPTPFPNDNFSTFLLKAPGLKPKPQVLGTMQAGGDLVNLVKQYNEYKLRDKGVSLAVGLLVISDIHSLGPDALAAPATPTCGTGTSTPGAAPGPTSSRPRSVCGRPPTWPATTRPPCSTWRPCSAAAPTSPTRWSSSSRDTSSTTCSPATPPSAPRTTCCCTTRTSGR